MTDGRVIQIRGTVQGVGFRPWVLRLARDTGVSGSVSNDAQGVTIEAFAPPETLDTFIARLRTEAPPAARIESLQWHRLESDGPVEGFRIIPSRFAGRVQASIPPDLATCDECLAEILDPSDRRYRYAFTSCTNCGPRFTISTGIPYDRPATTMRTFRMCEACQREYDSESDRRFHAQPNACPVCGPKLMLTDRRGEPLTSADADGDAIARTARLLAQGSIVAIKGLGGWHLACDATNESALAELRRRKRRDEKPFAVMVRDLSAAMRIASLDECAIAQLTSPVRPIVLARRLPDAGLATLVAPDTSRVGVLLPYTPLHHVLLRDIDKPLVMTSGNLSEEPIVCGDHEALDKLGAIADVFLGHDRAIASRADDAVVMTCAGRPMVIRRSRGYVPESISLQHEFTRPVLACGPHLKNTFCIATGNHAYLGPHIGDLENAETYDSYERAIERMEAFLRVRPEVLGHDLHPDYLSTRYAIERPAYLRVAIQHHHAHIASAMAEHGLSGPVMGVAFDGTGLGTDGTSWGGEILLADYVHFDRVARLRPVRLAGGDRAVRDAWRVAIALLDDAFDGRPPIGRLALFERVPADRLEPVRRIIRSGFHAPLASGLGRYFDAFGALGLARPTAQYEGQLAMAWDQAADGNEHRPYPFAIERASSPWTIDLRPTVRAATEDLISSVGASIVSARFHETIIRATAETVRALSQSLGSLPVVLTGGCFQNARLAEGLVRELTPSFQVHLHERVPPGDGGIALGQAMIANAFVRSREGERPCASEFPEE